MKWNLNNCIDINTSNTGQNIANKFDKLNVIGMSFLSLLTCENMNNKYGG